MTTFVSRRHILALALTAASTFVTAPLQAQSSADQRAAIAVADSILHALSTADTATLRRLSLDSTVVGGAGQRNGAEVMSLRSMRFDLARGFGKFVERGFNATVQMNDWIALVWMPYDLYREGQWSHCGVDTFTLIKVKGAWRAAALIYTIEQPPACGKHPDGPPK